MDFAICPACGQSVLDDDAVNCPFCGASMKAKPGSKPPAAAQARPAAKPAAKPAAAKKASDDDLPFDPQTNLPQTAVAASATPTKSRSLQVVCPMCETTGYVPPSAAGKTVKCANPKCMVPIFTAPAPEPVAAPAPPPKKQRSLVVVGLVTAVIVAALGGAGYFLAMQPTNAPPKSDGLLTDEDLKRMREQNKTQNSDDPSTSDPATTADATPKTDTTPVDTGPTSQELMAAALKHARDSSLNSSRNRSKPYCRRLSAEAHALAGDIAKAKEEIDQLTKVGPELQFYRIGPWVEVFWQAHAAGDAATASSALDQALADSVKLPKRGRDQMDVATRLAAALVVAGRDAEARALIQDHQGNDLDGAVSYWLMWIAADRDLKNPEALIATQPVVPRQFPQMAAISAVVTLHGDPELARKFALGWTDVDAKAEAMSAWAEALVWSKSPAEAAAEIPAGIADLKPASAALVLARAARAAAAVGDENAGKQLLARARSTLEEFPPPETFVIPARPDIVGTRPQFDEAHRRAAAAAAEIAVAPASVGGGTQAALETALQYARGLGPSLPAIKGLVAAADRMSSTELRNALRQELKLRTDDEARQAVGDYRRHLSVLEEAAQRRFTVQSTIMSRAVRLGLAEHVWLIASSRAIDADVNLQEAYLTTDVAAFLVEAFRQSKQSDLEKAVLAALGGKAPPRPAAAVYRELIAAGQFDKAWAALARQGVRSDMQEALVLETAVELAARTPISNAWAAITPVSNVVLREQALEWTSLIATRNGHAADVWKQVPTISQTTEMLAMDHGLIAGLADVKATAAQ